MGPRYQRAPAKPDADGFDPELRHRGPDPGAGKFYARYEKSETFKRTTNLQYMAQSTSPLGGNTGWKDITIHCGGGLTDSDSSDQHDGLPTPAQLKGDFSFLADNGTSCPRKAKALINFTSSVKDNVHYSLDCTNGHFSGVAQTAAKPGGGYVAPALGEFRRHRDDAGQLRPEIGRPRQAQGPHAEGPSLSMRRPPVDPASGDLTNAPKPKQKDRKDKAAEDAKTKAKADRDAAAKLKLERAAKAKLNAAAEAERRRRAAEKAAADKAKKDLAEKLKLLKSKKSGTSPRATSANGQTNVMRVR